MVRSFLAATLVLTALPVSAKSFDGMWRVEMQRTYGVCESESIRYFVAIHRGTMRYIPEGDATTSFNGRVAQDGHVVVWARRGIAEMRGTGELNGRSGSGIWNVSLLGCSGAWTARKS